eukprot:3253838-Amphidinium_carterae.2
MSWKWREVLEAEGGAECLMWKTLCLRSMSWKWSKRCSRLMLEVDEDEAVCMRCRMWTELSLRSRSWTWARGARG